MIDFNERMTLDVVLRLKKEKLEKIQESQKRIGHLSKEIFGPKQSGNAVDSVIKKVSTGFAIFDGIKIGINIVQKIKERLNKKTNK